jgi:hypothetical protein
MAKYGRGGKVREGLWFERTRASEGEERGAVALELGAGFVLGVLACEQPAW